MKAVRSLSHSISVVCTIHQPPSELVAYFQDVLLIDDGRVVYFGDVQQLPEFLADSGAPKIAPGRNLSEYALQTISEFTRWAKPAAAVPQAHATMDRPHTERQANPPRAQLADVFLASPYAQHLYALLHSGSMLPKPAAPSTAGGNPNDAAVLSIIPVDERAGFVVQTRLLTQRFFRSSVRNRVMLLVRYAFAIILGFAVGTLFTRLDSAQADVHKRMSAIFFTVSHFLFSSVSFFPGIFMGRLLYFRESKTRMYSAHAYFCGRLLGDLPHIVLEVFIATGMVYAISHLNSEHHSRSYILFAWGCLLMRLCSIFFTQLIASLIASPELAYAALNTANYMFFAFSGFFITYSRMGGGGAGSRTSIFSSTAWTSY